VDRVHGVTVDRPDDEDTLAADACLTDTSRCVYSHVGGPMAVSLYHVCNKNNVKPVNCIVNTGLLRKICFAHVTITF